ncbi:branched-chain-amino-acid aminotransferase 6-like [Vicia villosa]|uniref:branched-chain-amino-acid aminotransferase 6-like n=1 Tax=Vicia villosa TaxID=3911 RepID=UPI00273C3615|nr:branched-chain-amino-acid aminotransferase 6-like [Vicia villosa]
MSFPFRSSLSFCRSLFHSSFLPHYQVPYRLSSSFHTKTRTTSFLLTMAPPSILRDNEDGSESGLGESHADMNWEGLGFSLTPTDYMHVMKCSKGEKFSQGSLVRYGNIEISPAAGILNYGQGIFEGLKAYRTEDGRILLFRPEENALRMKIGAERLCMPSPSVEQFVDAVKQTVLANKRWIPPTGKGTLYLRPLLIGTGAALGVAPSPEYTFLIYCSPVGNYHTGGALNLKVEDKFYRSIAGNGGTGGIKSVTNYAPVYTSTTEAKANGFSDVLFLDSATGKHIEEATACNVFVVKENVIFTPAIDGTILPGITRKTIIDIAMDLGYKVEECSISVEEMMSADEVFCTGTAVVVTSVASVTYKETRAEYKTGAETLSEKLRGILVGIQTGRVEDKKSWTVQVE